MSPGESPRVIELGNLRIDPTRFNVTIGQQEVRLSRKEFDLLWTLASEEGRAFRRQELIERVWGGGFFIEVRTVDVHIARIRAKLKKAAASGPSIETVWGIGYRLRAGRAS